MAGVCTALHLYTDSKCTEPATNANGLFCDYHGHRAQALYAGYKRRNAHLDQLDTSLPSYLADSSTSLRNETFAAVEDEETIKEVHKYLLRKYNLLERVILARKLHHDHFYSQTMDYGHKAYLDRLVNDKNIVSAALGRLIRRTAEVLHSKQQWFAWVQEIQQEEEERREKESIRIKKEAQLFRRHMKETEGRARAKKRREDKRRQDAYLNQAYEDRLRQIQLDSEEDWDPIEDAIESEREDFIVLMKRLLWLSSSADGPMDQSSELQPETCTSTDDTTHVSKPVLDAQGADPDPTPKQSTQPPMSRNAKKRAKAKAKAKVAPTADSAKTDETNASEPGPKVYVNESREEMRHRLLEGSTYEMQGIYLQGTLNMPNCEPGRIPGIPEVEVDNILDQVAEIKALLFCRLLLSQSKLLPAALQAKSIPEFLATPEANTTDLRDLCLRVEQPSLQEIRDACADFAREDDEGSDPEDEQYDEQTAHELVVQKRREKSHIRYSDNVPDRLRTKREKENETRKRLRGPMEALEAPTMVDFGTIDDGEFKSKKIRIRVCGKSIFNYPSERSMVRGGWLQFSVIAKGSRFEDAATLCRNWNEFWELATLAIFNYFPSNTWATWALDNMRQQMVKLGVIPYLEFDRAEQMTTTSTKFVNRRRVQHTTEMKNVMCFYIKRNDPISRRFVQYLHMASAEVCVLIRDTKTGSILRPRPPNSHYWLLRDKIEGEMYDWNVRKSVGDDLFSQLEGIKAQTLQFSFNEIYDITVWSTEPGEPWAPLWNTVQNAMIKARRYCCTMDMHKPLEPVLKTLFRDEASGRCRDALPGEQTVYDDLHSGKYITRTARYMPGQTRGEWNEEAHAGFFYNDVDAEEDLILFPEEAEGRSIAAITGPDDAIYTELYDRGPNLKRFCLDLSSDDDSDDFEDPFEERSKGKTVKSIDYKKQEEPSEDSQWSTEEEDDDFMSQLFPSPPRDMPECPDQGEDPDCTCDECKWWEEHDSKQAATTMITSDKADVGTSFRSFQESFLQKEGHAYFNKFDVARLYGNDPSKMKRLNTFIWEDPANRQRSADNDPEADFQLHMDRAKSKVFKKMWHAADFDAESKRRWREMQELVADARQQVVKDVASCIGALELLMWLNVKTSEHRRVVQDMWESMAAMSIFFPNEDNAKMKTWLAESLKDSNSSLPKLVDNTAKASMSPYSRSPKSAATMPAEFWREPDQILKKRDRLPHDWDQLIRPMVARLLKAGLIDPGFGYQVWGTTLAATSSFNPEKNMYIDYRTLSRQNSIAWDHLRDPTNIDLLATAQKWAKQEKNARFALLRLWSHSHFYPLMMGPETQEGTLFADTIGRTWKFKFLTKDFPASHRSMHKNVEDRVFGAPLPRMSFGPGGPSMQSVQKRPRFGQLFQDRMEVKRDIVLVMGKDEDDLQRYATAATFALQSNPWRFEVDLWKSFINVDIRFLEGLDKKWLE